MSRPLLPLIPAALQVVQVLPAPGRITILTAPKPSGSACPLCGGVSSRVHSHYNRTLAGAHHKAGATGLIGGGGAGKTNEPFSACTLPGTVPLPSADDLR